MVPVPATYLESCSVSTAWDRSGDCLSLEVQQLPQERDLDAQLRAQFALAAPSCGT